MRGYTPSQLPDTEDVKVLKDWMLQELTAISDAIPSGGGIRFEIRRNAPNKPRNGMLVYADGTTWNPGSGAGFYGYESGSWVKL